MKKEILLFMTDFYGYNENIISEIKKNNYNVTWFLDKVYVKQFERILKKFDKNILDKKFDKYFYKSISSVKGKKFDEILIIFAGYFMKKKHIETLRKEFPNVPIVYYAWDSVKNFPLIEDLLNCSDKAYTFDPTDAKKYNVELLPLFYCNTQMKDIEPYYDVATVMSFYLEKANSLNKILNNIPGNLKKNIYLKLRDKIYFYKLNLFHGAKIKYLKKYFKYKSLSRNEVYKIFENSKAIIDCPLPDQKGLTMRTFEVLSLHRKLITTNLDIVNYDFYCPENIYVINYDKNIEIDHFLNEKFNKKKEITSKYSLENFVKKLLCVEKKEK